MSRPSLTGSAIERAVLCPGSVALPRVDTTSTYAEDGTRLHTFLQAWIERGRDAALEEAPEEARATLEQVSIAGFEEFIEAAHARRDPDAMLADKPIRVYAEIALAYDTVTGLVRILGTGIGRAYDVKDTEVPCTLDCVVVDATLRKAWVIDWKRGWSKRAAPAGNHQLRFGALCVAGVFPVDEVEVMLVTWRDEASDPRGQSAHLDASDLAGYAFDLEPVFAEVAEARAAVEAGRRPPVLRQGDHCHGCQARSGCPAFTGLVLAAMDRRAADEFLNLRPMPRELAAKAYVTVRAQRKLLEAVEAACYAAAAEAPLHLGENADGRHRWLGRIEREGNEKLTGQVVFEAVRDVIYEVEHARLLATGNGEEHAADVAMQVAAEVAGQAVTLSATKAGAEKAVKAALPKGAKGKGWDRVLELVREKGGAIRDVKDDVATFTTASENPSDDPRAE